MIAMNLATVTLITIVMAALPALSRPTLPFGVRVPAERASDPVIIAERRVYARLIVAAGVVAAALSFEVLAVVALVPVDLLLFYRAHRRVARAKQEGRWQAGHRQRVTVDTSFRTDPVRIPWRWALPALAVLLSTAALGWSRYGGLPATLPAFGGYGVDPARRVATTMPSAFQPVFLQAAITVLTLALMLVSLRARPDLDAARPRGSARRYRTYLRGIAVLSLLAAACLNLGLLISALQLWGVVEPSGGWRVATYLPLAALGVGALAWERRVGSAGHRLPALPGEEREDSGVVQRDDDRHWFLAGMVYVNRRDPALLVHARIGHTWTLNLGHPVAWVVAALLVGLILLALTGVVDLPMRESAF
ncbi:DUF5808 domain-containing protein [Nonomuraea recticatena]|uniref:DUF5808 domain-containing protein n=2 Tax=Nonomuraea recticatena TaxID=46178 RepID=A0ABP6EZD4_9ACTN